MSERLIRQYYAYFNQRRVGDAAKLFADDATFDHPPFAKTAHGGSGYMHFAETWLHAFPDAQLTIDHVNQRSANICEIDLMATGTHSGTLDLGPYGRLKPSGGKTTFSMRELLQVEDGRIVHSSLSFDIHDLLYQLANIDYGELDVHLGYIQLLRDDSAKSAMTVNAVDASSSGLAASSTPPAWWSDRGSIDSATNSRGCLPNLTPPTMNVSLQDSMPLKDRVESPCS